MCASVYMRVSVHAIANVCVCVCAGVWLCEQVHIDNMCKCLPVCVSECVCVCDCRGGGGGGYVHVVLNFSVFCC